MIRYLKNLLIALDQLFNTILGGWPDESLSSHCWRIEQKKGISWPRKLVDALLFFDKDHCQESYESELERRQLPPSMRE